MLNGRLTLMKEYIALCSNMENTHNDCLIVECKLFFCESHGGLSFLGWLKYFVKWYELA